MEVELVGTLWLFWWISFVPVLAVAFFFEIKRGAPPGWPWPLRRRWWRWLPIPWLLAGLGLWIFSIS